MVLKKHKNCFFFDISLVFTTFVAYLKIASLKNLIILILFLFIGAYSIQAQKADTIRYSQIEKLQEDKSAAPIQQSFFDKVIGYADSIAVIRDKIVDISLSFIGTPYKYSSVGPSSFDCSGFISYIYQFYNIVLPHSSGLQAKMGYLVDLASSIKGDLMFFGYKNKDGSYSVSHVGMVFSNKNGVVEMIHASSSDGVRIDKTDSNNWNSYWSRKFLFVKRIID